MSLDYQITTNARKFDIKVIHDFLLSSYWAPGIPRSVVERSIKNSLCFGAFFRGRQVGFARMITDRATFAYLADVFIAPDHRGRGLGKLMVRTILAHPDLQGLRRLLLATRDAHGLYAQFGFEALPNPDDFMTIHVEDIYKRNPARGKRKQPKTKSRDK